MVARIHNKLNTVSEHRVHSISDIVLEQCSKCSRTVNGAVSSLQGIPKLLFITRGHSAVHP
jgi:hypothetical protein